MASLENSKLKDPRRIENLVLGMAITSLWMIFLGEELEARGERTLLEAEHKQDHSLFRLGRDWLRRSLSFGSTGSGRFYSHALISWPMSLLKHICWPASLPLHK